MTAPAGRTNRLQLVELLLRRGGEVLLAARNQERTMYLPAMDLIYLAERGAGARRNGALIEVSATTALRDAVFDHSLANIPDVMEMQARTLTTLIRACRGVRCVHSLTYLARVADGTYDGFVYHSLGLWDICGPSVILEEAGAALTGMDGEPLDLRPSPASPSRVFAVMGANPQLLRAVRDAIHFAP